LLCSLSTGSSPKFGLSTRPTTTASKRKRKDNTSQKTPQCSRHSETTMIETQLKEKCRSLTGTVKARRSHT
jgi:hypothetical protein